MLEAFSSSRSSAGWTDGLVERARQGDADAYNALFARVSNRLLAYIRVRLGMALQARLDPHDVLQEAYLHIHRSFKDFRSFGEGAFCRWSYRIVDNRIRDLANHAGARKRSVPGELQRGSAVLRNIQAEQATPLSACAQSDKTARLVRALEELSELERSAVLLRYFRDETHSSIAEALGLSESGVRGVLARIHLSLGRTLEKS